MKHESCFRRLKHRLGFIKIHTVSSNKLSQDRKIFNGRAEPGGFCNNKIINQKYNIITFVPVVLYNQFKFFFNMFFLAIAITQFIPVLKVGFLISYVAPLVFVLAITLIKEAVDDLK